MALTKERDFLLIIRLILCAVTAPGVLLGAPFSVHAQVVINEIMYDVPTDVGSDEKYEWVELVNTGSEDVDLSGWKINDGSNHTLAAPPKNGGQGTMMITAGGYVVLADDAATFLGTYPVGVSVIDTSLSLNNTGDTIVLLSADGAQVSSVTYDKGIGAAGDGNSLQLNGSLGPAIPTPGKANRTDAYVAAETKNKKAENKKVELQALNQTEGTVLLDAGDDRSSIVGVPVTFAVVGVMNGIYEWNFGDGSTGVGAEVTHTYQHSGRYTAVVTTTLDGKRMSDEVVVSVSGADVVLRLVPDGIDIRNNARQELDISAWQIVSGSQRYAIAAHTKIAAGSSVVLSNAVVGFPVGEDVTLALPTGEVVAQIEQTFVASMVAAVSQAVGDDDSTDEQPSEDEEGTNVRELQTTAVKAVHAENEEGVFSSSTSTPVEEGTQGRRFSLFWFAGGAGLMALGALGLAGKNAVFGRMMSTSEPAFPGMEVTPQRTGSIKAEDFEIIEDMEKEL